MVFVRSQGFVVVTLSRVRTSDEEFRFGSVRSNVEFQSYKEQYAKLKTSVRLNQMNNLSSYCP